MEVNHAVGKAALVEQFELQPDLVGEGWLSSSDDHGGEEEVELVDQPGLDRLGGEVGTPDADVTVRGRLQLADRIDVEFPFDARPGARYFGQRPRVDDLLGRLPDFRVVPEEPGLVASCVSGLPVRHHLIHTAAVEVGADRPLQVVDEEVHLLARSRPVEVAVLVRDVTVERRQRRIDQLGHGLPRLRPARLALLDAFSLPPVVTGRDENVEDDGAFRPGVHLVRNVGRDRPGASRPEIASLVAHAEDEGAAQADPELLVLVPVLRHMASGIELDHAERDPRPVQDTYVHAFPDLLELERGEIAQRTHAERAYPSSSLYPTPHTFTTNAPGAAADSLRRNREACESSVRVRPRERNPQTSRSNCSFVKTRVGSVISFSSSSYSLLASATG